MTHKRTNCEHAREGKRPSQVVCAIDACIPNSHVGFCKQCQCYCGPDKRSPKYLKLGDAIANVTKATRIQAMADKRAKRTGKPCGCSKRKVKLNHLIRIG